MSQDPKINLLGLTSQELTDIALASGEPPYRARQLFDAIYRQRVASLAAVTPLPDPLRRRWRERFEIALPSVLQRFTSTDGTVRYLVGFQDGASVETVWMPEGDGGEAGDGTEAGEGGDAVARAARHRRATICVSSQAGCAVNCKFCLTALLGLQRNLSVGEIVGQVLLVMNDQKVFPPVDRVNLVFMGQGEPFHNYESFMGAVRLLEEGAGIPQLRMTVSTAGVVPRIYDFGREPVRPKLAISLNAPTDDLRSQLMPLNRKWDLAELIKAAREFPLRPRERLTFEYVLLRDRNDSLSCAQETARLLQGIRAKVNLIALNPGPGLPFSTPSEESVAAFQQVLSQAGVPVFVRRPRGRDIFAACGQLKRTVELAG